MDFVSQLITDISIIMSTDILIGKKPHKDGEHFWICLFLTLTDPDHQLTAMILAAVTLAVNCRPVFTHETSLH